MKHLTPENIALACGGTFYGPEAIKGGEVTSVTTDSRKVDQGALFIPIKGERSDGHDFIPQAMEKGAALVLTERPTDAERYPCVVVDSTMEAIQKLAHFYLEEIGCKVVSITGSVGKTSTKETIASVLSRKYKVKKTPGNFNNNLGLPLSIFTLEEGDEIAVLEMGINHFGEMDVLASIAPPDLSVITNIGTCHLEFLGDRDGVFRAKTEVFRHLKPGAKVILNGDDDKLRQVTDVNGTAPVFYGIDDPAEIYADNIEYIGMEAVRCMIHLGEEAIPVRIPCPGKHMVMNALAAAACGRTLGLLPVEIREGIESLVMPDGRLHIVRCGGRTVIDDCYNANPMSMKASLKVLSEAKGRKVAILGDMAELGKDEEMYHREVGAYAAALPLDLVITAGRLTAALEEALKEGGSAAETFHAETSEEVIKKLPEFLKEGDTILVKASHSMHFEKIAEALLEK